MSENTGILLQNKLIANRGSYSKLSGTAIINKGCENCISDINFAAVADKDSKIEFMPAQRISSVPDRADHGAAIYTPKPIQIEYLRNAGLGTIEINDVLRAAFMNDFSLF
jgi:Fe-S cluster assembly scaffold protein SufB